MGQGVGCRSHFWQPKLPTVDSPDS